MSTEERNLNYDLNNYIETVSADPEDCIVNADATEVSDFFDETEDAIFNLYEELFTRGSSIDSEVIYKAVLYLLWKKDMTLQYKEMIKIDKNDICVQHINDINKEVKGKLSYFKAILNEVVEDYI